MTKTTEYARTIAEIHATVADLTDRVERGVTSRVVLDAYLSSARRRADWIEPS